MGWIRATRVGFYVRANRSHTNKPCLCVNEPHRSQKYVIFSQINLPPHFYIQQWTYSSNRQLLSSSTRLVPFLDATGVQETWSLDVIDGTSPKMINRRQPHLWTIRMTTQTRQKMFLLWTIAIGLTLSYRPFCGCCIELTLSNPVGVLRLAEAVSNNSKTNKTMTQTRQKIPFIITYHGSGSSKEDGPITLWHKRGWHVEKIMK